MSSLNLDTDGRPTHTQSEHECLSTQLSLELRLRQNCQELLNLYKRTQDWSAVSQVAQSLVTNSQRVTVLKDLLSQVEQHGGVRPFLHSINESKSPSPEKTITDFHQTENHKRSPTPEVGEIELISEDIETLLEGSSSNRDREEELNLLTDSEEIDNSIQLELEACGKPTECFENKRPTSSLESPQLSDERQAFVDESEEAVAEDCLTNCDPNTFIEDTLSNKLHNELEDQENVHTTVETHDTNSPVKSATLAYSASSSRRDSNSDLFYSAPESLILDTEQDNFDQETPSPLPSDSEDCTEETVDHLLSEITDNQVASGNSEVPSELSEDQTSCREVSPTLPPDIVAEESRELSPTLPPDIVAEESREVNPTLPPDIVAEESREVSPTLPPDIVAEKSRELSPTLPPDIVAEESREVSPTLPPLPPDIVAEESSQERSLESADYIDAAVIELNSALLAIDSTVADLLMADTSINELSDQPIESDDQSASPIDQAVETSTVIEEREPEESSDQQTELSDEPCDKTEPISSIHPTSVSMESNHEESGSNEQPPDDTAKSSEQIEMTENTAHESTLNNEPDDTKPSVKQSQSNSETVSTEHSSKEDSPAEVPHDVTETPCKVAEIPCDVSETPCDVSETPCDVLKTPCDVDETPCDILKTPCDVLQTPCYVLQTPCDVDETPSDVLETPHNIDETPSDVLETPHDVDETLWEVLETPSSEQTDPVTNGTEFPTEEPSEVTHVLSNSGKEATREWTLEGNVGSTEQANTNLENAMSQEVEEEATIVQDDVSDKKEVSNGDGTCIQDPDVVSKVSSTGEQKSDQITTETETQISPDSASKISEPFSQDSVAPSENKSPPEHSFTEHKSSEEEPDIFPGEEMAAKVDKKRRRSKALTNFKNKSVRLKQQLSMSFNLAGNKKPEDDTEAVPTVKPLSPIVGAEWDPTCLLEELYSDYRQGSRTAGKSGESARYFGYLQKLPMNKSKAAFTKGFKRRYFRAMEGKLYYFEERTGDKALGFVKLEHSRINPIPEKLQIQVVQKDGKSLMVKTTDLDDLNTWYKNLNLEAAHPTQATPTSPLSLHNRGVVIIDIGAASVRAGYAGDDAYPELFFPAVATLDPSNQEDMGCGIAALQPETRFRALQIYPRRVSRRMDQRDANSQLRALDSIISYVVMALDFEPTTTQLVLTLSPTVPEADRNDLIELLFDSYQFAGLCVQEQAILALYSYNTTSGIVVDIGDHIDIVPIIDGYVIEAGVTRLPFGGSAITESLSKLITARGIRYFSETESYIIRLIKESLCFVAEDYLEIVGDCETNTVPYTNAMDVDRFQFPDHRKVITLDSDRFKAPEGLFSPSLWGRDVVGLHDHVWKAIQACSIDQRKQVAKSVYLSGGCTLLPGLQERLQKELNVLAGSGLPVEVHAGPSRQHAAFIGASVLSSLGTFSRVNVVTLEEWCESGVDALNKWKTT